MVMTEENDLIHYGRDPVFVYDPNDASNRPVKGVHDNVIKLWQIYPDYIRQAFTLSFTYGIQEPNARIIEKNWIQMLMQLKMDIIHCGCGRTAFLSSFEKTGEHSLVCQNCGSPIYTMSVRDFEMPLYPGAKLYRCVTEKGNDDFETVTGAVIENRLKKGLFASKTCLVRPGRHCIRIIPSGKWDRGKVSRSGRDWRLISAMESMERFFCERRSERRFHRKMESAGTVPCEMDRITAYAPDNGGETKRQ